MFTICFSPGCASILGRNASTPLITPQRFTPSTHSQSLRVRVSRPPITSTPALLQSTWQAPSSAKVRSARASTESPLETSVRHGDRAASGRAHLGRDLLRGVGLDVGDRHVHALGGKTARERRTDPASAAGHHRHLARQVSHGGLVARRERLRLEPKHEGDPR